MSVSICAHCGDDSRPDERVVELLDGRGDEPDDSAQMSDVQVNVEPFLTCHGCERVRMELITMLEKEKFSREAALASLRKDMEEKFAANVEQCQSIWQKKQTETKEVAEGASPQGGSTYDLAVEVHRKTNDVNAEGKSSDCIPIGKSSVNEEDMQAALMSMRSYTLEETV